MTRRISGVFVLLALSALAFTMGTPALAEPVTFSTTGGFSASGGASSATFGFGLSTLTLSYAGIVDSTVGTPTNSSAGLITASVTGTGGDAGGTFTLTIDQTAPSVGSGGLDGDLSGTISSNSSLGTLDFTSTSLTLGDIVYTLQQPPGGYDLVPPSTLNGETSIQLNTTASAVPEPAFLGLTGLGFFGIVGITFLRNRRLRVRG
jgi:hypothetical protein